MDTTFHFPPDLINLLIDTIPRLNKSKKDLLLFFKNIGVPDADLKQYKLLLQCNSEQFNKFNVTRELLERLNVRSEAMLGIRRQLLQKVVCFDSFDMCWENDRLIAKSNVSEISKIVKLKDSVTKLEAYVEQERQERIIQKQKSLDKIKAKRIEYESVKNSISSLFSVIDPQKRGKALESALNNLFILFQIGVKEAFSIIDEDNGKNYEQIDGVVEINNYLTLVEMKWENKEIGVDKVSRFMSRIFLRANVDGIIISYSSYTESGVKTANEALSQKVIALIELQDILTVLVQYKDLKCYFEQAMRNVKLFKKSKIHIDISALPDIDFNKLIN